MFNYRKNRLRRATSLNEHAILPHVIVTDDDEDLREMVADYLAGLIADAVSLVGRQ